METQALVSLEEYLTADYEVDCDFVDGTIEERNVGTKKHAKLQSGICSYFVQAFNRLRIHPFLALCLHLGPRLYRVPDICLFAGPEPEGDFIALGDIFAAIDART